MFCWIFIIDMTASKIISTMRSRTSTSGNYQYPNSMSSSLTILYNRFIMDTILKWLFEKCLSAEGKQLQVLFSKRVYKSTITKLQFPSFYFCKGLCYEWSSSSLRRRHFSYQRGTFWSNLEFLLVQMGQVAYCSLFMNFFSRIVFITLDSFVHVECYFSSSWTCTL